jgi:hypothetical protein
MMIEREMWGDADHEFLQSAETFIQDCFSPTSTGDSSVTKATLTLEGLDTQRYEQCKAMIEANFGGYALIEGKEEVEAEKDREGDEVLFCRAATITQYTGRTAAVAVIIKFLGFRRESDYGMKLILKKFEELPRASQLALAMSHHGRLGMYSPLQSLPRDLLSKIMQAHVNINSYFTPERHVFVDMLRILHSQEKIYIDAQLKQIKHSGENSVDFVFHLPDGKEGVQICDEWFQGSKTILQAYVKSESRTVKRDGELGLEITQKLNIGFTNRNSGFTLCFKTHDWQLEGRPSIRVTRYLSDSSPQIRVINTASYGFFLSSLISVFRSE